nr:MAG TPA: hypothetical protein [Caudoviricetes sp.]
MTCFNVCYSKVAGYLFRCIAICSLLRSLLIAHISSFLVLVLCVFNLFLITTKLAQLYIIIWNIYHSAVTLLFLLALLPFITLYLSLLYQKGAYSLPITSCMFTILFLPVFF